MASGGTTAAVACFFVLDWHGPLGAFERHFFSDVLRHIAGMNSMTGFAGPSLLLAVNVEIVQVDVPVAKIGQGIRVLTQNQILFVTLKAQSVVFQIEGHVERVWESLLQEFEMSRSVGVVAGRTVTRFHGSVEVFSFSD